MVKPTAYYLFNHLFSYMIDMVAYLMIMTLGGIQGPNDEKLK